MPISTLRILDAIEQLAADSRGAAPGLYSSLQILIGELRRRDRGDLLAQHYADGCALLHGGLAALTDAATRDRMQQRMRSIPATLDTLFEWPRRQQQMENLSALVAEFCALQPYPAPDAAAFDASVAALLKWEAVEGVAPPSTMESVVSTRDRIDAETLQQILREAPGGWPDASVSGLRLLNGGVSKSMVQFELQSTGRRESLVARIDSDLPILDSVYRGMKISHEFHLLRYLNRNGMTVAEPRLYVDANNILSRELFVKSCLPGNTRVELDMSQRAPISAALLDAIAALCAKLHRLPIDLDDADIRRTHLAFDPPRTRRDAYRRFVAAFERDWQSCGEPRSPGIETTLRWLAEHVPADDRAPCIVHGDCGPNNLMIDGDRVTGLVDWETAHYGDPAEDLACFLFLTQGVVEPVDFIEAYERAGGVRPDAFTLRYHAVIARMKLLIARDVIRQLYESRALARPELAVAAFVYGDRTIGDLFEAVRRADAIRPHSH
jgi:aminoglycoside phosphotransferase (APT) family kinase protein